jgi:hypothetical protein
MLQLQNFKHQTELLISEDLQELKVNHQQYAFKMFIVNYYFYK